MSTSTTSIEGTAGLAVLQESRRISQHSKLKEVKDCFDRSPRGPVDSEKYQCLTLKCRAIYIKEIPRKITV
jgi:hypothetical protein